MNDEWFQPIINAKIYPETHSISKLLRGYHGRAGDQVQANFGIDISYHKENLNIQCHCDTSIRASVITNILNQRWKAEMGNSEPYTIGLQKNATLWNPLH